MAIKHVDLYNGNDSNDGNSWSTAWLTTDGKEAALSNGDTLKVSKTPDAVSIGNADWVDGGMFLTLAFERTKTIENCIGNTWTPSTNVTATTATGSKIGANNQLFNILAAFTTGKVAYKTLPLSLNLTSFQNIFFWLRASNVANFNNGSFRLCLCSDTLGNTVVNSIAISTYFSSSSWQRYLVSVGAFGSSIQSIALYCDTDSLAVKVQLNNIFATNDFACDNVLAKSSNAIADWWAIKAVDEKIVYLETGGKGYSGTTETTSCFMRKPFTKILSTYSTNVELLSVNKAFAITAMLNIEGGWNPVNNERDGITWLTSVTLPYVGFHQRQNFQFLSRFGFSSVSTGVAYTARLGKLEDIIVTNASGNGYSLFGASHFKNLIAIGCSVGVYGNNAALHIYGLRVLSCSSYSINNNSCFGSVFVDVYSRRCNHILNAGASCKFINIDVADGTNYLMIDSEGGTYFKNVKYNGKPIASRNSTFIDCDLGIIGSGCYNANVYNTILGERYYFPGGLSYIDTTDRIEWRTDIKPEGKEGSWLYYMKPLLTPNYLGSYSLMDVLKVAEFLVLENVEYTIKILLRPKGVGLYTFFLNELFSSTSASFDVDTSTLTPNVFQEITLFSFTPTKNEIIELAVKQNSALTMQFYLGGVSIS